MNSSAPAARVADEFLRIETAGVGPIPVAGRHGRPRELGFLWAGAFVNYVTLLTTSLLTSFYGLGVWDGLAATALGTLSGAILLGLLSTTGPAGGLPQIAFTRRILGDPGVRVGALLTLFLAVGWFAVDSVVAAQAGVQLLQVAGLPVGIAGKLLLPWVLLIAAVSVAVAVYGHRTIKVFETYGVIVFAVLSIALFAVLAPQMHWGTGPTARGADYPGAFILGFMTCFALVASWYPFAADYSRYLPADSSRRAVTLWPVLGVLAPMLVLGLFGLLLPTIDPKLAGDQGILAVVTKHAPSWAAVPFFAFVVLGEIWANYLDVYTAGLVSLTMGVRLQRWQTALGCGVLGALLATYAVVVNDFHNAYQQFLILTYLWAPAWAAVVLLAVYFARGDADPRSGILAWAGGAFVSLAFVNYPNIYPSAHAFNQGLINALHGADLSGLVSVGAAAGLYLMLRRSAARGVRAG